jgi:hypothetical protein
MTVVVPPDHEIEIAWFANPEVWLTVKDIDEKAPWPATVTAELVIGAPKSSVVAAACAVGETNSETAPASVPVMTPVIKRIRHETLRRR